MSGQLKNIVIFSAVYTYGNYRDAASVLSMSIATISKSIKELEDDGGSRLFINVKGDFRPTVYAHSLYEKVRGANNKIINGYNLFKSNSHCINVLLPPPVSSYNLIDIVTKINKKMQSEITIIESTGYGSREESYTALINGELDLMIDYKPNNSATFISKKINEYELFLFASKNHYKNLCQKDITEKTKLAKYIWLGEVGWHFKKAFGILEKDKNGIITQNSANYFKSIERTNFIGMCLSENLSKIEDKYVFDANPFMNLDLYFIATKSAIKNREIVKLFYNELISGYKITPGRDIQK